MTKLLRAGVFRLFRYRLFWLTMAAVFAIGCAGVYTKYADAADGFSVEPAGALFAFSLLAPLAVAVVSAMFTGGEFDCGAVRNKLSVGCSRESVYLSNLTFAAITAAVAALAYVLPYGTGCLALVGPSKLSASLLAAYGGMALVSALAWTALFQLLIHAAGRKASAAVACLLLFMALVMAGLTVKAMLDAPEFITGYTMTVNGIEQTIPEPNPKYLQPAARAFWAVVLDLLPGGQCIQLSEMCAANPFRLTLCALGETAAFTLGGMALFRRKDLK